MSGVETAGVVAAVVLKWLWLPISGLVGHIWWSIRRDKVKLDNTLTKAQTDDLIQLNLNPIKQELDLKIQAQNTRIDSLLTSFQASVESLHDTNKKINHKLDNIQTDVSGVKQDVAVLKNEMSNVKNRLDRQNIG